MDAELLRDGALFINVGRGTLVRSGERFGSYSMVDPELADRTPEEILAGLEAPTGLSSVVLDVTNPEPLPAGHPLLSHPRVLITPHMSGHFGEYYDLCTDVLLENVKRLREGRELLNVVDPAKGY
jgi:phosphoglycerate dehydrogenase-like enzyme